MDLLIEFLRKENLERIKKSIIFIGILKKKGRDETKKSKKNIPGKILHDKRKFKNNKDSNNKVSKGKNFSIDI